MKKGLIFLLLISPLLVRAQIDCPAFGRAQSYEQLEILLTWNTVDPYPNFGGIDLQNDAYQFGDYKNTSIAPGITINYYPDNSTILRLKAIYTNRNVTLEQRVGFDSLSTTTNINSNLDQTLFKIAPGFGWVGFVERFSFYGGFELPFTYQSDFTVDEQGIDSNLNNKVTYNSKSTIPGGYSIGLGLFAGSTFYFPRLLGVGFEISSAYQYTKLGGTIDSKGETTDNPPVEFSSSYFDQKTTWKFSPLQASLHLSIRF